MIRFPCGTCGRRLRVPTRLAGKRGRCERCGAINRVPLADVLPPDDAHRHDDAPGEPDPADVPAEGATLDDRDAPPSPPRSAEDDTIPPTAAPVTRSEAASSFSTEAVPVEQSVAVDAPPPPAFGIDEASVFPPIGDFGPVPEIDFSPPPADADDHVGNDTVHAETPHEDDRAETQPPVDAVAEPETDVEPNSQADVEPDPRIDEPSAPEPGGEIKHEPAHAVLPVDVRRAAASPFRSTADMRPRGMIEGSVEVPGGQFAAATTLPATAGPAAAAEAGGAVSTFLDLVAQRVGVIAQPAPASVVGGAPSSPAPGGTRVEAFPPRFHAGEDVAEPDEEPVVRILHIDVDDVDDDEPRAATPRDPWARAPQAQRRPPAVPRPAALPPAPAAPRTMSARRAVVIALAVGLIVGFVLGLLAADLL